MSNAQRRATKRYRERHRRRGLQRLEVQVPADGAAVIRKAAAILRDQTEEATRLRVHLGFSPEPRQPMTALDAFAMKEPLSPEGEKFWEEIMTQVEGNRKDPVLGRLRGIDP
jgi:hypothetical protein